MSKPELPLCICHHWRGQHPGEPSATVRIPCQECGCRDFVAVSSRSSHVYQRATHHKVSRPIGRLKSGDLVLVDHTGSLKIPLVPALATTGALLAKVEEMEWRRGESGRQWKVTTDLGALPFLLATDRIMVAK